MSNTSLDVSVPAAVPVFLGTAALPKKHDPEFKILGAISIAHLANDMMQSLILAVYPLLKHNLNLNFTQIGLITLTYQITASMLQPVVGATTDRAPKPYSLAAGMGFTLVGLLLLSVAHTFALVLLAAATVGIGSSIFHPESSRVARLASGGRYGMAQSLFQVGGNAGSACGPLLAALIVAPFGQGAIAGFSLVALGGIAVLTWVGHWYREHLQGRRGANLHGGSVLPRLSRRHVGIVLAMLFLLVFSKAFYLASLQSYFTFYLIHKFHISVQSAQLYLFAFLFAVAAGTLAGGPIGDRFGRKYVICFSILGVAPFTLLMPHANLLWTGILSVVIGLILASAFSAILVYAQELMPGKVGTIAGLFFGLSFGLGGIGAAVLGTLSDRMGIEFVYRLCAFLPLLGIVAVFLPDRDRLRNPAP